MCKALKFVTFLQMKMHWVQSLEECLTNGNTKSSDKPVKLILLKKQVRAWQCQCFPDMREEEEGEEFYSESYSESKGRTVKKF